MGCSNNSTMLLGQQHVASSMNVLDTFSLLMTCLCMGMGYVLLQVRKKHDKRYPPFAPGSMLDHLKIVTSPRCQWRLLDVANQYQYKVFQLSLPIKPMTPIMVVGEARVARAILTDPLSIRPMNLYNNLRLITGGKTMLTMNGHGWYSRRKAAAPAFSSNHVKRMTRLAVEKTEAWIQDTLKSHDKNNSSFDINQEMLVLVLSALTETAFEYKMSKQEAELFRDELHLALVEFMRKSPTNPIRSIIGEFIPERRRADLAVQKLRAMIRHIMDTYRGKKHQFRTHGTIIELVMESDTFPNDKEKAAQLFEFLVAGYDTTAQSISWILLCLAQNPEEQRKLRDSLSRLSKETWASSEYLRWVVKEGMRKYPVLRSVRQTGRDVMTSNGLIPKGSICGINFMILFHNPDTFEDPSTFQPSRWENATQSMKDGFHQFSLGNQNCIGQSLARAQIHAIVARICSEFELSVEDEGTSECGLTLKPVGLRLKARNVV